MSQKFKSLNRKKCSGGLANCRNYVGDYKDVEGVGCCEQCDKYVDENPYDPYWENMEQDFGNTKEYEKLERRGLLEDYDAYQDAFERYQESYEPWPDMRRRMASQKENGEMKLIQGLIDDSIEDDDYQEAFTLFIRFAKDLDEPKKKILFDKYYEMLVEPTK
jgi:hypothetical protein